MPRGRKAGVSESEKRFRERFVAALGEAVGSERGAQSRVAEELGVKRQLISLYLKGHTTPSREFIRRALELPGFALEYGGVPVDRDSLGPQPKPRTQPQQLRLFSEDQQLKVVVLRRSVDSVELKVSINFKRQG